MTLEVNNEAALGESQVAEFVSMTQLGWIAQDSSGLECLVSRTLLGNSELLSQEQRATVQRWRGAADAAFGALGDILARPRIDPSLADVQHLPHMHRCCSP
jgi:hypothetical protein